MKISEELKDQFREIYHIGVGRAAAGIASLLDYKIEMNIPEVYFLDQPLFDEYMEKSKEKHICVLQHIHGELEGIGSLSFPLIKGKTLVDNILNTKLNKPQFGAVEIEAIQEVGNIMINAVGGAFANIIGLRLDFDTPIVVFLDYPVPKEISNKSENFFYTIASATLGVKEIDVSGILMLTFAYSKIELIEQFLQGKKTLSKKFGELLLEEHYITPEQLEEAIMLQKDSKKFIGELMVDRKYITAEQRDTILNSQKYKNSQEKFGEMILKENLITPQQLTELLQLQKHAKSFLGEILVIMKHIDENTKEEILMRQKMQR